uniref:Aspartate aminotransferase n=1 Tax=Cacopsylla melanoneura TaxID=428564 RepID=A0A8D9BRQ4_9HEMI
MPSTSSLFTSVEQGPPIEVFAVNKAFLDDTHPDKVNLSVGAYRTEECKPWVLPVVRDAEKRLAADDSLNHEYLPVLGLESFTQAATSMLLGGSECKALAEGRAFGIQTLSGTGALRVGAEFLHRQLGFKTFYYSNPTWENHGLLFKNAGFTDPRTYRYWNAKTRGIDFDGMYEDFEQAPDNSVIILHACAHNPTGCDPTKEQWSKLAQLFKSRPSLFIFFDSAYQGFASGDLERDAYAVRYFAEQGFEFMCAQSFAKNFGLYNERIGNLTLVLRSASQVTPVKSQLTLIVRAMYSTPPNHGARIVSLVLNDPTLYNQWKQCIQTMSSRIKQMRLGLRERLEKLKTPGAWEHITEQIGMFSYTGLNPNQVAHMVSQHHVYLLKSGRINMCGLTTGNLDHVAGAIHDAVTKVSS